MFFTYWDHRVIYTSFIFILPQFDIFVLNIIYYMLLCKLCVMYLSTLSFIIFVLFSICVVKLIVTG